MHSKLFLFLFLLLPTGAFLQPTDPWTPGQLMAPADLAARIRSGTEPLVICVGPSGLIKGSIEAGPAREAANLDKLKALLDKADRNREVVIYCGCCPFVHCPNVRPAFNLLIAMHFTHPRLLDLSHNIKTDWLDHSYPVKEDAGHAF